LPAMAGLVKVTLFLFSKCSKSSKISLTRLESIKKKLTSAN